MLQVKLCDFGLAANSHDQKGAGTPAYMAPELHTGKSYNEKVDIYAFGIMMWELVAKRVPFDGASPFDIKNRVIAGTVMHRMCTFVGPTNPFVCKLMVNFLSELMLTRNAEGKYYPEMNH